MNAVAPGEASVHHGDMLTVLPTLDECSVDSCVTDPPYHLASIVKRFGAANAAPAKSNGTGVYKRASAGFMGQQWDGGDIAFRPETWAEVYRVLKPGAHLLAFGGTRTFHRMAVAIEDAGFEVRDTVFWLYATGFPKSHDVAKGIDRTGGLSSADQAALLRARREAAGLTREEVAARIGCTTASVRDWEEGRARATGRSVEHITPSAEYRGRIADLLGYSADERRRIGVATDRRGDGTVYGIGHSGTLMEGGATDAARQWEGWGTALKPAVEPIILARKPLDGTIAENVLRHGTGALNIDACRVGGGPRKTKTGGMARKASPVYGAFADADVRELETTLGRWPANLCHDGSDEVLAAFARFGGKEGTPDRFFFSGKATKAERCGSKHPTVKPQALMRWLVTMVTPPGGVVLDPFAGSGSTLQAAVESGFRAIGVEREDQYVTDIERRLARDTLHATA